MRAAVFLDRDGTVIELVHHLTDPADVVLIPGAAEAIAALQKAGLALVLVTNQSVIGRGKLDAAGLEDVHTEMTRQLIAASAAPFEAIHFCPLAPTIKDPTVIEDPMRKPGPGMLLAAAETMALDLDRSWMVGDTVSDMLAGRNAGCRTILVETGYGRSYAHGPDAIDHRVSDLSAAAEIILNEENP